MIMMIDLVRVAIALSLIFGLLYLSVYAGRWYGRRQLVLHGKNKLEVVIVAEGAVFTLLALLVAFSFSGAYDRFENRQLHIIDQVNAIDSAYKQIDLLAPETQPAVRDSFRAFIDAQLDFYKNAAHVSLFQKQLEDLSAHQDQVWQTTVAALKKTHDPAVTQLLVPAVNNMFDATTTGVILTRVHPPAAIFLLLLGLAILSGFLAGYSTSESKSHVSLHILSYVLITALTIYIILALEFPRAGVIRIDRFDRFIVNVRQEMNLR